MMTDLDIKATRLDKIPNGPTKITAIASDYSEWVAYGVGDKLVWRRVKEGAEVKPDETSCVRPGCDGKVVEGTRTLKWRKTFLPALYFYCKKCSLSSKAFSERDAFLYSKSRRKLALKNFTTGYMPGDETK